LIARELIGVAVRGLLANRLRSSLTMLGILIGVAAVIILLAVGNGSAIAVQKRIEALGTNTLTVFSNRGFGSFAGPGGGGRSRNGTQSRQSALTAKDVKALSDKTQAPDVKSVSPVVNASVTAAYNGATYQPSSFVGSTPSYFEATSWSIAAGRFFDDDDEKGHARVVVLGQTVVGNLFGSQDPIGATVQMDSASFQVIGVLARKGTNGPQDQDDVVVAPLTAVQDTLTGQTGGYQSLIVQARSSHVMDEAEAEVTSILDTTHDITDAASADFRVLNQGSLLAASTSTTQTFTVLLGAVAAISLLVGGIGVMNIMLVTVTERTREIGIRKAIGARRADILGQFLAEAVILCLAGGIVGVLVGVGGSHFKIVGVTPVIQPWSIALAFAVSVAVGLFFGIYPANRAAALRPIDALRYE
jgi:putative ABC transport system permease protein